MLRLLRKKFFKPFLALLIAGIVTIFIGTASNFTAHANPLDQELSSLQQQIEEKKEEINRLNKELDEILTSKRSLSSKISLLERKIAELERLSEEYNKQIDELIAQLKQQEKEIERRKQELVLNNVLFYLQTEGNLVFLVLDSNDLNDIIDRFTAFVLFQRRNKREINRLLTEIEEINDQIQSLKDSQKEVEQALFEANKELSSLRTEYARIRTLYSQKAAIRRTLIGEVERLSKLARQIMERKFSDTSQGSIEGGGGGQSGNGGGNITDPNATARFVVKVGKELVSVDGYVIVRPVGTTLSDYLEVKGCGIESNCSKRPYFGDIEFYKNLDVWFVNILSVEKYLYGLGEMPSSFHKEALKAQAVAARSYALAKKNSPRTQYYDILDSVQDQKYIGASKIVAYSDTKWKNAVDSTLGEVLKRDGAIITAYYHSTAGGFTLSSQEVWGGRRSYAVGGGDRYYNGSRYVGYDEEAKYDYMVWGTAAIEDFEFFDIFNVAVYLAKNGYSKTAQNKVACCVSPKCDFRWQKRCGSNQYNKEALINILGPDALEAKIQTIEKVEAVYDDGSRCNPAGIQWNVNPYVPSSTTHSTYAYCTSIGSNAKFTATLRVIGVDKNGKRVSVDVPGRAFSLAYNIRSPQTNRIMGGASRYPLFDVIKHGAIYYVYSQSFGHRVGLSQYGANGRAKAGQDYKEILRHYYNGTPIVKEYSAANIPQIRVGVTEIGGYTTTIIPRGSAAVVRIYDENGALKQTVHVNEGQPIEIVRVTD